MIIKTWRDPYDVGFSPTHPTKIEINPGLTVLVGCNGAGKTTLLKNIKDHCIGNKIPCYAYDNLSDGGSSAMSELLNDNYNEGVALYFQSEGECIKSNISRASSMFKSFFTLGYIDNKQNRFRRIFADEKVLKKQDEVFKNAKERVLLFDAVDSGLSVDSVIEIKRLFDVILADASTFKKDIYIVIAANEYELARNTDCFDVNTGKYLKFSDYEDYRKFIIKRRMKKDKRNERLQEKYAKKKENR